MASLLAIGFAGAGGKRLGGRQGLLLAVTNAPHVPLLLGHAVVRVLAGLLPFGLAGGLVTLALFRHHDIAYYLERRPTELW